MRQMWQDGRDRTELAAAFYVMLGQRGQIRSHRVLAYRCRSRCLLVDVLNTKHGLIVHLPRYKLSPAQNEASSTSSGRAANTEDGNRRWKAHTFFEADAVNVAVTCDHIVHKLIDLDAIRSAIESDTPEVVIS